MWFSSEAYDPGFHSPITPTCNHLQDHRRQRKHGGARDILLPTKWSSRCKGIGFQKGASLSFLLTIWSLQTQQDDHIGLVFDPANLFSWQIHSFLQTARDLVLSVWTKGESNPSFQTTVPCNVATAMSKWTFWLFSPPPPSPFMLLKITGILTWLQKLGSLSMQL